MTTKLGAIPDPQLSVESLQDTAAALKNTVEVLARQQGKNVGLAAVTWNDLVTLGLIEQAQIPKQ